MSKQNLQDYYKKVLTSTHEWIETIVKKKYLIDKETCYSDLITRFNRVMSNHLKNNVSSILSNSFIDKICQLMEQKKFIPAGSILAGLGNNSNKSSLSNCYYIPFRNDSIESIYQCLSESARVYSWRGGVGFNITTLRPKNTLVSNAAKTSSGAVSFIPLITQTTNTIGQNGRRGASIIVLDVRHPDILDFIKCKSEPQNVFVSNQEGYIPDVTSTNISVLVNDSLFDSKNEYIDLIYPDIEKNKEYYNERWNGSYDEWQGPFKVYGRIKKKDLIKSIAEAAWKTGDPGILFLDNIYEETFMSISEKTKPRGVNPCGEQILTNYGNCLLFASNLSAYVENPWSKNAVFNKEKYFEDLKYILMFGDYIVDINKHPLEKQNQQAWLDRKIGHETTGLADCLSMLNIKYDSEEAIEFTNTLYMEKAIKELEYETEFASTYGCCPLIQEDKSLKSKMVETKFIKRILDSYESFDKNMAKKLKNNIIKFGIRNFGWSTQGPCGTISIVLGNVTSGIEPLYAIEYFRETKIDSINPTRIIHTPLLEYLVKNEKWNDLNLSKDDILSKYSYKEAHSINVKKRIEFQGVVQKWITDSISSTINLPTNTNVNDIIDIIHESHKNKLKGITIYRDGCSTTSVLKKVDKDQQTHQQIITATPVEKQVSENDASRRYIVRWKKFKVYINVTHDNNGYPTELFAHLPYEAGLDSNNNFSADILLERMSYWDSICRLVGVCLRFGVPLKEIIKQLNKATYNITHLTASISRILKEYPINLDSTSEVVYDICPSCSNNSYIVQSGCKVCINCGYGKCD